MVVRLTPGLAHHDGPDFSACGEFIWFNSDATGQAQIWRMRADGSEAFQDAVRESHRARDPDWLARREREIESNFGDRMLSHHHGLHSDGDADPSD